MLVKSIDPSMMKREYGVSVCRLLDHLPIGRDAGFGSSLVEVEPGGAVVEHSHAEHEVWVITSGRGEIVVDGQARSASPATMVYMRPDEPHAITNASETASLEFLAIWWD